MNKILIGLLLMFMLSCQVDGDFKQKEDSQRISEIEISDTPSKSPMMGWASWNHYRIHINEDIIKSQANAMVDLGLQDFGYSYINIDDGFFGGRNKDGKILSHPERFPSGMKSLSEYIHSKGLKAGIYSDAGINTCASYWDKDTIGSGMGLYGHDEQDLAVYLKEWNYDFIKVDWCGGEWLGLDEEQRYSEISDIIYSIKQEAKFNVCRWKFPGKWVTSIADSWRISGDINNQFESILNIIDLNADLWSYASKGHYNDMDMLQVGRGMTYEEDKTHFTMWCLMHSPLLLGNDITKISKETLEIITNKDLIDINQSEYVYQARRVVDYGDMEVWAKPLQSTMSGEVVVALLNRSDQLQNINFDLHDIGLIANKLCKIKDLWTKEEYPCSDKNIISKDIPAHGVIVLKITGKSLPFNVFQYKEKQSR